MIKNLYPLLIAAFLFSCSSYLPYSSANQVKSITDIPLKASTANIDCFFNNQIPAKPFYRVKITEVTGDANASYDELIISIKNKAKQEGLDGVLILDKKQENAYENLNQKINVRDTSVNYYTQLAKPYQKLTAIGIKYIDNINYLDTIVKATSFEFGNNNTKGNSTAKFDFYGNQTGRSNSEFDTWYVDSIEPFEIDKHLLLAVKGWQYKTIDASSSEIIAFKKQVGDVVKIDVKRDYNDANKFSFQFLSSLVGKPIKYLLKLEKNAQGKIVKKTLYKKNIIIWVEDIFYTNNAIAGYKRYRFNKGKEEIIFSASNQYFSVKDLPEL
ncbi:hypothetical protein [Ferruginibacter sp.]|nr:hypothetical protein [Ferruginibacter sp.]